MSLLDSFRRQARSVYLWWHSCALHHRLISRSFPCRVCCEGTFFPPPFPLCFWKCIKEHIIINLFLSSLPPSLFLLLFAASSLLCSRLSLSFRSLCSEFERFFKFRSLRSLVSSLAAFVAKSNLGRKWRIFEQFRRYHPAVACRHYCDSRMNSRS